MSCLLPFRHHDLACLGATWGDLTSFGAIGGDLVQFGMIVCQDLTLAAAANGQAQHLTLLFLEYFCWLFHNFVMPIQTARPVGMTLNKAFQDSAQHLTSYNKEEEDRGKGTPAYLQSCDPNPDSQASGHDTEHSLPGLCLPSHQLHQGRGRKEAKAIQVTCNLVIPIQTARPVGMTLTMAFQGWP